MNNEKIPLSEGPVLHISSWSSTCEAFPSNLTPTLTKMLYGVKAKLISAYNVSCVFIFETSAVELLLFARSTFSAIMEN